MLALVLVLVLVLVCLFPIGPLAAPANYRGLGKPMEVSELPNADFASSDDQVKESSATPVQSSTENARSGESGARAAPGGGMISPRQKKKQQQQRRTSTLTDGDLDADVDLDDITESEEDQESEPLVSPTVSPVANCFCICRATHEGAATHAAESTPMDRKRSEAMADSGRSSKAEIVLHCAVGGLCSGQFHAECFGFDDERARIAQQQMVANAAGTRSDLVCPMCLVVQTCCANPPMSLEEQIRRLVKGKPSSALRLTKTAEPSTPASYLYQQAAVHYVLIGQTRLTNRLRTADVVVHSLASEVDVLEQELRSDFQLAAQASGNNSSSSKSPLLSAEVVLDTDHWPVFVRKENATPQPTAGRSAGPFLPAVLRELDFGNPPTHPNCVHR